nr:MAG TPA: hypothetical protein [Caudoviricetes sp.]
MHILCRLYHIIYSFTKHIILFASNVVLIDIVQY